VKSLPADLVPAFFFVRAYEKEYPVGARVDLMLERGGYQERRIDFEVREIGNE
jgi:hypothetical protein